VADDVVAEDIVAAPGADLGGLNHVAQKQGVFNHEVVAAADSEAVDAVDNHAVADGEGIAVDGGQERGAVTIAEAVEEDPREGDVIAVREIKSSRMPVAHLKGAEIECVEVDMMLAG